MSFIDWIFNYNNEKLATNYTVVWGVAMAVLIVGIAVCIVLGLSKKISQKAKKIILICLASTSAFLEIAGRVVFAVRGDELKSLWPLFPCSINSILIIIAALTNCKIIKRMVYTIAPIGAFLTFVLPQGVFSYSVLTFVIIRTIILHLNIILIPLFEYCAGFFRAKFTDFLPSIYGLLIQVVNCEVIVKLLGNNGDFTYFNSGYPFTIPWVPGWVIVCSTAILTSLFVHFLYFLRDKLAKKRQDSTK